MPPWRASTTTAGAASWRWTRRAPGRGPGRSTRMPERPPLAGVPIAIKDALSTRDIPTTAGSRILEGFRPVYTATVRRAGCERAGAVVIGKTNMDEFAMGSARRTRPTRSPATPGTRTGCPGGSSGGSAAAVAAFQAPWRSAATPAARSASPRRSAASSGSSRRTARVSRYGLIAFASSLDQVGPFARTVRDAAAAARASSATTRWTRRRSTWPEPYATGADRPARTARRRGRRAMGEGVDAGVRAAVDARARADRGAGRLGRAGGLPTGARHRDLLPDRAGGVLVQPRPLRRHPLRP